MKALNDAHVITFKHSFIIASLSVATLIALNTLAFASSADDAIESSFKKSYVYRTYLKDEKIKISSKEGVVVLSGEVFDDAHKPMAEHTAEELFGVKSVDNKIVVREDRLPENSDTWIRMKVQTALVFHSQVSASKTEVYVTNGVVTLKGIATSAARRDLTTEYAKKVEGVKSVSNQMKLVKPEPISGTIDDASITAQVKMTLILHGSTSAMRTSVKTKDGIVTVGGKAQNSAEIDLVTKLVEDVEGVSYIINTMSVDKN